MAGSILDPIYIIQLSNSNWISLPNSASTINITFPNETREKLLMTKGRVVIWQEAQINLWG